jgi:transposase-like protein
MARRRGANPVSDSAQFQAAYRLLRESELHCPKCKACNIGKRKKTIELEPSRRATCDNCGHVWTDKEQP